MTLVDDVLIKSRVLGLERDFSVTKRLKGAACAFSFGLLFGLF